MDLAHINTLLAADSPSEMRLRVVTEYAQALVICFSWNGGPNEDIELVVTFERAAVFHLAAMVSIASIQLRACSPQRVAELIPAMSYDESEHNGANVVVEFTNGEGRPLGYYVMAAHVSGEVERAV